MLLDPSQVPSRELEEIAAARWVLLARDEQLEPDGEWGTWYIIGGRGSGKTRCGSETLAQWILDSPAGDWAIVAPTFGDARDVCTEGPSGLLVALGANPMGQGGHVTNYNRSYGEIYVDNGSIVYLDGADDGALRVQGKNLRGAWCIAEYVDVTTARGMIPIRDVRRGDLVATRNGWAPVTNAQLTAHDAPLVRVQTRNGDSVDCTPEHLVWTENRGWVRAETLTPGDILPVWETTNSPLAPPHGLSGTESAGTSTFGSAGIGTEQAPHWLTPCGASPMAPCPTVTISTTSTATRQTTDSSTSRSSPRRRIVAHTLALTVSRLIPELPGRRAPQPCGLSVSPRHGSAGSAAASSSARPLTPTTAAPTTRRLTTVKSVKRLSASADVYDLTVAGEHEFVAGGILVHNCDEVGLWRNWDTAWNESLAFAIRLDPGKIVATGTPKQGHPLVRTLIKDDRVAKTHMRMTDNLANLLPARVQELRDKYEGTRRGRQELEGEFLEDVEGALWTAELLDKTRVDDHPGDLHRVVVAVDPAGSSKQSANAAGIVVVGKSRSTGHGYVIADYTLNAPPETWGRKVIEAYHAHDADSVVAESNYGGDIVKAMLQLIDQRVPVRMVNATRGKRLRAEPISMLYEQGKAHHVGVFPELEEEQTMWTPDAADSPNRLDALVWGLTAVMLSARGASQDEYRPTSKAPVVQRGDLRLVGKRYVDQGR